MMLRFALLLVLCVFAARTFWKMVDSLVEGLTGRPKNGPAPPPPARRMERDPVCGTFVLPAGAVSLADGRAQVYFCSAACRDRYRAQRVQGRTA
jgi:YHS domain-containing protein